MGLGWSEVRDPGVGPGAGGGSTAASAALRLANPGRAHLVWESGACASLRVTFDLTLLDPVTHWHTVRAAF